MGTGIRTREGGNRLAHLQAEAAEHYCRHKRASTEAIAAYLAGGAALIEAKAALKHGEWLPWLAETGIPERTARRMMRIARTGLKSATVADLGGVEAALALPPKRLATLARAELPGAREIDKIGAGLIRRAVELEDVTREHIVALDAALAEIPAMQRKVDNAMAAGAAGQEIGEASRAIGDARRRWTREREEAAAELKALTAEGKDR